MNSSFHLTTNSWSLGELCPENRYCSAEKVRDFEDTFVGKFAMRKNSVGVLTVWARVDGAE